MHRLSGRQRKTALQQFAARSFAVVLPLCLTIPSFADSPAPSVAEQVKAIGQRYDQIEEQLPRSVRYGKREETADGTIVTQAWFDGVGDLLKVATERTGPQGRELTEHVATAPDNSYNGLFILTRKETPAPDGGTQVEETRRYYGQLSFRGSSGQSRENGVLIRELRKSAHFAPGQPLDTSKTPNTSIDVPKPTLESASSAEVQKEKRKLFEEPERIAAELQAAGIPEADPLSNIPGDSERFRLVHGSVSPDGRYAIAIGFEQPVDWSQYADETFEQEKEVYTADEAEGLRNYIVDLTTNRIVGPTGGDYFGTRRRYNHRECDVTWSSDSSIFVEVFDNKWNYESCHLGRIAAGPKLVGTIDLGKEAERYAKAFLKSKGRKYDGSIALSVSKVNPDGTIELEVYGQSPSVPNKGEIYFHVGETLRLRETGAGLQLHLVKARLLPND